MHTIFNQKSIRNRLIKVKSFKELNIRNGVIMLIVRKCGVISVLTVTHYRTEVVGLPGGGRKKKDTTAFSIAKREYEEETGNKLPSVNIVERFLWIGCQKNNDTAIFVVTPKPHTHVKNLDKLGKNSDGEVTDINIYSVDTVKKAIKGKLPWRIRHFEKKSIGQIFEYLKV